MIPELGQFALILALLVAAVQATLPLAGAATGNARWMALARPATYTQFALVAAAFVALAYAFVVQDFTVAYVAQNSNLKLPVAYRITAVWGSHEGSLLLWMLILCIWSAAAATFTRALPQPFRARMLAVLGMISVGFLLFVLLTSNPFERQIPPPADGRDLNPLLQDPAMIAHPPMLYTGYVGFAVAFAFAMAALIGGKLDTLWARWSRPWTHVAWAFLTLGITLGSWWAYYELGWGGWWFWDPVENASFMPWLVGTALIHSQAVTDRRGALKGWTVLLAIIAFSLSLLGTFLVRSGVLTSVHAFASDPTRGVFILGFLAIVAGGALTLYAIRAPRAADSARFDWFSRETLLLTNNLFLTVTAATVLVGTLYPLAIDAMGLGKISVGPPYFGLMFTVLMAPILALLPLAPLTRWRADAPRAVTERLRVIAAVSLIAGGVAWVAVQGLDIVSVLGIIGACWIGLGTIQFVVSRARETRHRWLGMPVLPRGAVGMALAHFGVAIFIAGATVTESLSTEEDVRLAPGESHSIGAYRFQFEGSQTVDGPNYRADEGTVGVYKGDRQIAMLAPQKRQYSGNSQVMTEAAINPGFTRDLYVALGEPLEGGAWSLRLYHKPLVRWIWLGALFMMVGGFVAATDRRYATERAAADARSVPAGAAAQGAA